MQAIGILKPHQSQRGHRSYDGAINASNDKKCVFVDEKSQYKSDGLAKFFNLKDLELLLLETSGHFKNSDKVKKNQSRSSRRDVWHPSDAQVHC
ncbi:hypothetical protein BDF21DRAFT_455113 [Thamnidium elegans]|nr:hypothetical protein BDF21DRAFT_455113 [Thamnidium elegans]